MTPQERAERSAEAMWASDAASQALGMRILEVAPGRARVEMTVRADMLNGQGTGHGGLTFSLADTAFAFACNSYNRRTVARVCEIRFRAPTRLGDVLVAEAVEQERGERSGRYEVTVRSGDAVVATFVGHSRQVAGTLFDE